MHYKNFLLFGCFALIISMNTNSQVRAEGQPIDAKYMYSYSGSCQFSMGGEDGSDLCAGSLINIRYKNHNRHSIFLMLKNSSMFSLSGSRETARGHNQSVLYLDKITFMRTNGTPESIPFEGKCKLSGAPNHSGFTAVCTGKQQGSLSLSLNFRAIGAPNSTYEH